MPSIKPKGFEYGKCKCRKGGTDDTHADDIFLSLVHRSVKVLLFCHIAKPFVTFPTIYPIIPYHSSHNDAEYPIFLRYPLMPLTFAIVIRQASKDHREYEKKWF